MVGQRYPSAAERPPGIIAGFMSVKFTGSEYWVIRSDPSLAGSAHTLLVRVQPEGLARGRSEGACIPLDGRLTASVIVYSVSADSLATGRLWSHPEWATEVLSPRWQEADSLGEAMEFLVPGFGTSANAAVLVLSHGDGPSEGQARVYPSLAALRYRVNLAVHTPTSPSIAPIALSASPAFIDDRPAWSPNGQELLFERKAAGTGLSRIYRDSVTRVVPGPPVPLTAGSVNQYQPDWSPRGDWVAFTQDSAGGSLQRDVWLYNVGTGVSTQLTNRPGWETSAHSNPTDSA
jgi:hypothetical protein